MNWLLFLHHSWPGVGRPFEISTSEAWSEEQQEEGEASDLVALLSTHQLFGLAQNWFNRETLPAEENVNIEETHGSDKKKKW